MKQTKKRRALAGAGSSVVFDFHSYMLPKQVLAMHRLITHHFHQKSLSTSQTQGSRQSPPSQLIERQLRGWSGPVTSHKRLLGVVCAVLTEAALSQFRTLCLDLINSMFLIKLKSGEFLGQLEQETIFGLLGNEF